MKVFVHIKKNESPDYKNEVYDFCQIPIKGDLFSLGVNENIYKVVCTVHTPFKASEFDAEVYATEVDLNNVLSDL